MRRSTYLAIGLGLMFPATAFAQPASTISGAWALVSLSEDHHGQITHPLGDKPHGQVIFGEHGELSVILLSGDREKKPGNPLTPTGPALAYYGTYSVTGDSFTSSIADSTYPAFAGSSQKGKFTVKADSLTVVREVVGANEPFTATLEFVRAK